MFIRRVSRQKRKELDQIQRWSNHQSGLEEHHRHHAGRQFPFTNSRRRWLWIDQFRYLNYSWWRILMLLEYSCCCLVIDDLLIHLIPFLPVPHAPTVEGFQLRPKLGEHFVQRACNMINEGHLPVEKEWKGMIILFYFRNSSKAYIRGKSSFLLRSMWGMGVCCMLFSMSPCSKNSLETISATRF